MQTNILRKWQALAPRSEAGVEPGNICQMHIPLATTDACALADNSGLKNLNGHLSQQPQSLHPLQSVLARTDARAAADTVQVKPWTGHF